MVDKDVEVTSEHDALPVPGGHVEAVIVPPGLAAHHGGSSSLPNQSSASSECETDSVGVVSVPLLNIPRQLGLPPLFLKEKQGEEHQKGDNAENQAFNISRLDILYININSPII